MSRDPRFSTLEKAAAVWSALHPAQGPIDFSTWKLSADARYDLRRFLFDLMETSGYLREAIRPHLAARVCQLLEALNKDAELRSPVLGQLYYAIESCGDRLMLEMGHAELMVRVHQAEQGGGEAALKELLLGFMKLEIVHKHALQKAKSIRIKDPVEVVLYYEVALRDELQLPVNNQTMLFTWLAKVSDADLIKPKKEAQEAAANELTVSAYLEAHSLWQRHLRRKDGAVFLKSYEDRQPIALSQDLQIETLRCPVTREFFHKLERPLVYINGSACTVYEAEAFLTHWIEKGTDPATRQPLALQDLVKPIKKPTLAQVEQ